ncbi:malto-oligosyltrehalose trehalohydrolase [Propionimicrobium sp. PCR01-08-3]|uniref:malto-oligosyltrehalose trehalohydrolase n=1 Tax=Propionimicrobium sp. PCR01-08-3 TaxID=3052086 RepID=UPI00255CFEFA|nr:malto-oligosyltrehalose trehalohydrolase [Propionimicrobium sp. PCR01-08-3]WIY83683.1 malto-oligosyltrehalose trehalohydrolase [Propionimicrobium sp. PCR01-08-3]
MTGDPSADRLVPVRLWAPLAHSAFAVVGDERLAMRPETGGYWTISLPAGTDYLLAIDDQQARPDPRSAWQPYGVDGPSRVFDTSAFAWSDPEWAGHDVIGSVFYELHVGTFTPQGTLDSAIDKLDYLKKLGIQTIELMPVVPFPGDRGWGYDGVDLYAVHQAYGGPEALQRFVDAAHAHDLAVCLDVVYNHFGPAGNYAPVFAPYFTDKHDTPWGSAINLDDDHADGVRDFICENAIRWLREFHMDALRLDAVHALADDSPQHILAELSERVDAIRAGLGRPVALIAESDLNQPTMIEPRSAGGLGIDAQWADDVHHALHSYLTDETFGYYVDFGPASVLRQALERVFVHDGSYSTFRGKRWGAPVPPDIDHRRFVAFTQNHDQVGNRGMGDRPDVKLPAGAVAGGAALLLLSPFTPLLFQGQEWGTKRPFQFFTDHDAELGEAVTEGRLSEFEGHDWEAIYGPDPKIPDPQALSTFENSKLDWPEIDDPDHARMLAWYRRLIELRHELFPTGGGQVQADFGDDWFRMVHGPVTVIICPGPRPVTLGEPRGTLAAQWGEVHVTDETVQLPAHSVAVLID